MTFTRGGAAFTTTGAALTTGLTGATGTFTTTGALAYLLVYKVPFRFAGADAFCPPLTKGVATVSFAAFVSTESSVVETVPSESFADFLTVTVTSSPESPLAHFSFSVVFVIFGGAFTLMGAAMGQGGGAGQHVGAGAQLHVGAGAGAATGPGATGTSGGAVGAGMAAPGRGPTTTAGAAFTTVGATTGWRIGVGADGAAAAAAASSSATSSNGPALTTSVLILPSGVTSFLTTFGSSAGVTLSILIDFLIIP